MNWKQEEETEFISYQDVISYAGKHHFSYLPKSTTKPQNILNLCEFIIYTLGKPDWFI